jgi:hypothetical protein
MSKKIIRKPVDHGAQDLWDIFLKDGSMKIDTIWIKTGKSGYFLDSEGNRITLDQIINWGDAGEVRTAGLSKAKSL